MRPTAELASLTLGIAAALTLAAVPASAIPTGAYTPLAPCRIVDTRVQTSPPPGRLAGGATAFYKVAATNYLSQGGKNGSCGIPLLDNSTKNIARAVMVNIIAVSPVGDGFLRVLAGDDTSNPQTSVLNYTAPVTIANGVIVPMCTGTSAQCTAGDIQVTAGVSATHVVIDVLGYFAAPQEMALNDKILQIRSDQGVVPGLNLTGTGGNLGILRLRNRLEIWPNDALTAPGSLGIFSTAGQTISLDGGTGLIDAKNMPAVKFQSSNIGDSLAAGPTAETNVDFIVLTVPASGFITIQAWAAFSASGSSFTGPNLQFELRGDTTTGTTPLAATRFAPQDGSQLVVWTIPVSAGTFKLTSVVINHSTSGTISYLDHTLTATYSPKQM